jgi:hypothetical protein
MNFCSTLDKFQKVCYYYLKQRRIFLNNKKYKVKIFMLEEGKDEHKGKAIRIVVDLGKDLEWKDAKEMRKANKGSWIV